VGKKNGAPIQRSPGPQKNKKKSRGGGGAPPGVSRGFFGQKKNNKNLKKNNLAVVGGGVGAGGETAGRFEKKPGCVFFFGPPLPKTGGQRGDREKSGDWAIFNPAVDGGGGGGDRLFFSEAGVKQTKKKKMSGGCGTEGAIHTGGQVFFHIIRRINFSTQPGRGPRTKFI